MHRRRPVTALVLALATAAVAGCGGGPGLGAASEDPPSSATSSAAPDGSGGHTGPARVEPDDPPTSTTPHVLPGRAVEEDWTAPERRPNILMVTVDDATQGDLRYMPVVRRALVEQGTTFPNAVAPTPICAPSRASLLTGQNARHHGTLTINGKGGGYQSFKDGRTLPVWLQRAGYDTMFVGKYVNGYGDDSRGRSRTYVPPGWDDWRASLDPATYDYSRAEQNVNGEVVRTPRYNTDVFADDVDQMLAEPRRERAPWYLWVNYVAPHFGGPVESDDPVVTDPGNPLAPRTASPAPRDRDRFADLPLPRTPDMFEADTSDKPPSSPARYYDYERSDHRLLREEYQQRIESLQSVDRAVGRHLEVLRRTGQLDDTLVVFTSDNGFVVGQHNLEGKLWHYREISGIPVVMRGPGIPRGQSRPVAVSNPDLPVSFAALAGARPLREVDGINVFAHLGPDPGRRVVPLSGWQVDNPTRVPLYTGVRVGPWTYVRFRNGGEEAYWHARDPYELRNLVKVRRYRTQVNELRRLSRTYRDCEGTSCPQALYR